jgi:hypothetical protein
VQEVGNPVRQRGRGQGGDRVETGGVEPGPLQALGGQPAHREAGREADAELHHEQEGHVGGPVAGLLDPLDEADHEQHRHRVVQARLPLERARDGPAQGRAAQQREDRGAVRGRDDRAEQKSLERAQVEQPDGGHPGQPGGDERADEGQRDRRAQHRPDLLVSGGEAALEQDEGKGDDADRACQLVVLEVDPVGPVGADDQPDGEEQQ